MIFVLWTLPYFQQWMRLTFCSIFPSDYKDYKMKKMKYCIMWTQCSTWVQSQKWQNDLCFQGKSFDITVIQVIMSRRPWTSPHSQYQNQTDDILCSRRWRNSIQSAKTRLGADCGSDHELLIAKFRLKLKKVGKPTRPFGYDLNQNPYYYTVEVANRFKGLDLIDRVPEEL